MGLTALSLAVAAVFAAPPGDETPEGRAVQAEPPPVVQPRDFVRSSPRCPKKATHCFGIFAHVVFEGDEPVESPAWLADRVSEANRLFAVIDVGFRVAKAERIDAQWSHVATRLQRDEIGADKFKPGVVHLFVIGQLDDVDVADSQIRGVHWRLRRDTTKRWILMSKISGPMVLAHELGHFFSLPHSTYGVSIMNKRPRDEPPWEKRRFAKPEVEKMRAARDAMVAEGMLVVR